MYDTAQAMSIPFLAGSSVPVAWRTPELNLPQGSFCPGALVLGYGPLEAYGFHSLEGLQCMVERRRGGETGVATVQAVRGEAIAGALKERSWSRELLEAAVAATPAPRTGRPRPKNIGKNAVFVLIEYRDGLRTALAFNTDQSHEFAFAGQIMGEARPSVCWFRMHEVRPFTHFALHCGPSNTRSTPANPPTPWSAPLLTTGILDAAMHARGKQPHHQDARAGDSLPACGLGLCPWSAAGFVGWGKRTRADPPCPVLRARSASKRCTCLRCVLRDHW